MLNATQDQQHRSEFSSVHPGLDAGSTYAVGWEEIYDPNSDSTVHSHINYTLTYQS
jgi:hypothetical protein